MSDTSSDLDEWDDRDDLCKEITVCSVYPESYYSANYSTLPKASDCKRLRLEDVNTFLKGVMAHSMFYTLKVVPNATIDAPGLTPGLGLQCFEWCLTDGSVFVDCRLKFFIDLPVICKRVKKWVEDNPETASNFVRKKIAFSPYRQRSAMTQRTMHEFVAPSTSTSASQPHPTSASQLHPSSSWTVPPDFHSGMVMVLLRTVGEGFQTGTRLYNHYGKNLMVAITNLMFAYCEGVSCHSTGSTDCDIPGSWCVQFKYEDGVMSSIAGNPDIVLLKNEHIKGIMEIKNIDDELYSGELQIILHLSVLLCKQKAERILGALIHPYAMKLYEVRTNGPTIEVRVLFRCGLVLPPKTQSPTWAIQKRPFIQLLSILYNEIMRS